MKKKMIEKISNFEGSNEGKSDLEVTGNFVKLVSTFQKEEKKASISSNVVVTSRLLKDKMSFVGVRDRRYLCELLKMCENDEEREIIERQIHARDDAEIKFIKIYEPLLVDYVKTFKLQPSQWKETLDEGNSFLISSFSNYNFDSLNLFSTSYLLDMKSFINNYIQNNFFNRSRSKAQNAVLIENFFNKYYAENAVYPTIEEVIENVEFKNNGSKNEETLKRYVTDIYNELLSKTNYVSSINDKMTSSNSNSSSQKQVDYEEVTIDESYDPHKNFEIKVAFQTIFDIIEKEKLFSKDEIKMYKKFLYNENDSLNRENIVVFLDALSSSTSANKYIAEELNITPAKAKELVINFVSVLSKNEELLKVIGDMISNGSICK